MHIITLAGNVPLTSGQETLHTIKGGQGFCLYHLMGPECGSGGGETATVAHAAPEPAHIAAPEPAHTAAPEPPTTAAPTPPPATTLTCPAGHHQFKVTWDATQWQNNQQEQTIKLTNGMDVQVKYFDTGNAVTNGFTLVNIDAHQTKGVFYQTTTTVQEQAVIQAGTGQPEHFPADYGTMEIVFPEEMQGSE